LQTLFTRHRAELRSHGILYPATGVISTHDAIENQTNLAWELLGHIYFDPTFGSLDQLVDEIGASDCPKVLLSSEEFACLFDQPEQLDRLKECLEGAGYNPRIALVLREPTEIAASLYLTLVSYGLNLTFAEYSRRVAEDGRITIRQNTYCFDNAVLKGSFVEVFGRDAVTCVQYDPADAVRPVIRAFDWFFDEALRGAELDVRVNTSVNRADELRKMIRAGESTITELKVQIEHLQEEARLLRNQLGASERRFSRRAERRIRAALQPFWPR
jgi:hypothetical protein